MCEEIGVLAAYRTRALASSCQGPASGRSVGLGRLGVRDVLWLRVSEVDGGTGGMLWVLRVSELDDGSGGVL